MAEGEELLTLTADIVAAHLSNNTVAVSDVPTLVQRVHEALAGLGAAPQPEAPARPEPKVSVRSSVKPDSITCLLCGKKQKTLKRHLMTSHGMTPQDYRAEFGLRDDYPMVAPNYAETRRDLAKKIGLGTKGRGARGGGHVGNGRTTGRAQNAGRPGRPFRGPRRMNSARQS